MNKYKAAIFDLDGTTANTLENLAFCANTVISGFGIEPVETDRYKYFVGDGSRVQMQRLLTYRDRYSGPSDEEFLEEVFARYLEFLSIHCADGVVPYDGMPELLSELNKINIKCAVFSNKPHKQACKVVSSIYPENTFTDVLGQKDSYPRKPDPAGALMLAEEMKVYPHECLYVGDTNTDMKTGKAAGMFTIGVLWGFRDRDELEKAGADVIVSTPAEILDLPGL
ncbi:MAG: HAD family hydrolase [Lachnospiraceae bacterium]|nr:HAD family hydrolase [Lachnospiraceae bacterium]MBQ9606104.1 HAD family hydrolase [Lachnospiraceae bacterium]MBR1523023.1 HAD family hydrolase [Lachnospiraceae bacterium]